VPRARRSAARAALPAPVRRQRRVPVARRQRVRLLTFDHLRLTSLTSARDERDPARRPKSVSAGVAGCRADAVRLLGRVGAGRGLSD